MSNKTFMQRFVRFTNRWFVDLVVPISEIADLEMVLGADTLLDKISEQRFGGRGDITLYTTDTPTTNGDDILLTKVNEDECGATYTVISDTITDTPSTIWLCNVSKEVFGSHPRNIYITF